MGVNNSSKQRVLPVFALLERRADDWARVLLELAAGVDVRIPTPRPWAHLRLSPARVDFTDADSGRRERSFAPAKSLLQHLVNHAVPRPGRVLSSDDSVRRKRERLLVQPRDALAVTEALDDLARGGRVAEWCTFEGPTFPDAVIETPDALIVVEGKFTEAGPTTHTQWMKGRHQMLRHLDGAWEARGARSVFGLFAIEGADSAPFELPDLWRKAVACTHANSALESSLPHRSVSVRREIADAFVGAVTWQAIVRAFGLPESALPPRV